MAERVIHGETYKFEKLRNPFDGAKLLGRVVQFFGPAGGYLDRIFDQKEGTRDVAILAAMGAVIKGMDIDEVVSFLRELCSLVQIKMNGAYEPLVPDHHLRSEMEMFEVVFFVLEVQFKDFFVAAKASRVGAAVMESQKRSSNA